MRDPRYVSESAFSLLETVVVVFLLSITVSIAVTSSIRLLSHEELLLTRQTLVGALRMAQSNSMVSGHSWTVRLAPFAPVYWLYDGPTAVEQTAFAQGVTYKDGYLQLPSSQITYDILGNSTAAGRIRLVNGRDEDDIALYMGSGTQTTLGGGE